MPKLKYFTMTIRASHGMCFDCSTSSFGDNLEIVRIIGYPYHLRWEYDSSFEKSFIEGILSKTNINTLPQMDVFTHSPLVNVLPYAYLDKVKCINTQEFNQFRNFPHLLSKVPQQLIELHTLESLNMELREVEYIPFRYLQAPILTKLTIQLNKGYESVFNDMPTAFPSLKELYITSAANVTLNFGSLAVSEPISFKNLEILQLGAEGRPSSDFDVCTLFGKAQFPKLKMFRLFEGSPTSQLMPKVISERTVKLNSSTLEQLEIIYSVDGDIFSMDVLKLHAPRSLRKLMLRRRTKELRVQGLTKEKFEKIHAPNIGDYVEHIIFDP